MEYIFWNVAKAKLFEPRYAYDGRYPWLTHS